MECFKKEKIIKSYNNNKIWCNNLGITGKKYYSLFFSFILISIPYILLLSILISNKKNLPISYILIISSILYIITIISLIRSGCSDPGILHKHERDFKYNPRKYNIKSIINGNLYEINYCYSCLLFKPPRTSHCALCDNCIERFDHHCKWIGQCVGQRNYGSFYILILCLFFSCIFYICYSLNYIVYQAKKFKNKENYNKFILWGLTSVCLYNIILLFSFIGKLFITHTYLQFKNKTFYEYLKKKFGYIPGMNPFKKYKLYICKRLVLKCPGKSFFLYFVKHPEKLKLMTLDEEFYLSGEIEYKIDIKKNFSITLNNKFKIENNYINNTIIKKERNIKDYENNENKIDGVINLKSKMNSSSFGEIDKMNYLNHDIKNEKKI